LPEKINSIDECPIQLKTFIKKIEETTGNHISLISYGPDRNQTFKL
jgi:adenylosuccinate synthase